MTSIIKKSRDRNEENCLNWSMRVRSTILKIEVNLCIKIRDLIDITEKI